MADKILGHVTAALETLAVEHQAQLAPIAEWVEATTRFVEQVAALDGADMDPEAAGILQQLMNTTAEMIIRAQQDVLKQTMAAALAIESQKKIAKRLVKARTMPGRPAQLVRP